MSKPLVSDDLWAVIEPLLPAEWPTPALKPSLTQSGRTGTFLISAQQDQRSTRLYEQLSPCADWSHLSAFMDNFSF